MSISEDLRLFLLADSTLSSLISNRLYPVILPQNAIFPAITYQWISGNRLHTMNGASGLSMPRIQFDCWAKTYMACELVFEALRKRLDVYKGLIGSNPGHTLQGAFFANEFDAYEPDPELFRRSCDFKINYEEAIT